MNNEVKLDTPKEIGVLVKTTAQTVLNWYHAGVIPAAFAVGRTIRFDRNAVIHALAEHTSKGGKQ